MIIACYKVSAIAGYNSYIIPIKVSDTTPQVTKLQAMMELDKCADSARAKIEIYPDGPHLIIPILNKLHAAPYYDSLVSLKHLDKMLIHEGITTTIALKNNTWKCELINVNITDSC